MNYERLKKLIVSLTLTCVVAISMLATGATSVFGQDRRYWRDYDRWERRYDRDDWRRARRYYRDPWVRYRYPYWYGTPRARYYDPIGPFYPYVYYRYGRYPWWW